MSFSHRPLTPDDAQAGADLIGDYDAFHNGETDRPSPADIVDWWRRVPEDATVGVVDGDGRIIGVGMLRPRGSYYIADNFVHPDARGRGIGSFLLDWTERRGVEAAKTSVRVATTAADERAKELIESRGYGYIRSFYRMSIELDEPPPSPVWPPGLTVSTLESGEERLVYEAIEEAFSDHWGHEPRTFEQWSNDNPLDEPSLCFLVRDADGAVAAAEICSEERFGVGWVDVIGVRAAWRRRGIGEALLRLAFCELYARGRRRVGLGVDAENTTGATRLYERVGMEVAWRDDAYEKLLQPAEGEAGSKLAD